MRLAEVPVAPAVVGLILGPIAEEQLRRALALSEGDWTVLWGSPLTVTLWTIAVLALVLPPLLTRRSRSRVPA